MKFLTISRLKDSFFTISPELQMQLVAGVTAFADKNRKAGKLKEIYNVPGLKMIVGIWEAESAEESTRLFLENPMFPFMDVETYTLSDWGTMTKAWKEAMERRAAAMKK